MLGPHVGRARGLSPSLRPVSFSRGEGACSGPKNVQEPLRKPLGKMLRKRFRSFQEPPRSFLGAFEEAFFGAAEEPLMKPLWSQPPNEPPRKPLQVPPKEPL
eukprot:6862632-Pyramimonas_sp.AAC.2